MSPDLYYCIAAYNEAKNISECLHSLAKQDIVINTETMICLNGCNDSTESIVLEAMERYPRLNIKLIHSRKGKTFAQNAIVRNVKNRETPLVFVDADVTLDKRCVRLLYEEMCELDQLIVVGGWPVPSKPEQVSEWEDFLCNVLHVRALHPESELSKHDVSKFKNYVYRKPQPRVSPDFELRSKIYFHGRIFMMRNADFFQIPDDENVSDDTFLPNMIHTKFGPSTIRTRYDAIAYYKPYLSLREHFKIYRRIYLDISQLDERYKEFEYSRSMEKTKLNWTFILSQGFRVTMYFLAFSLTMKAEEFCYKLLPRKRPSEVWQYGEK